MSGSNWLPAAPTLIKLTIQYRTIVTGMSIWKKCYTVA